MCLPAERLVVEGFCAMWYVRIGCAFCLAQFRPARSAVKAPVNPSTGGRKNPAPAPIIDKDGENI